MCNTLERTLTNSQNNRNMCNCIQNVQTSILVCVAVQIVSIRRKTVYFTATIYIEGYFRRYIYRSEYECTAFQRNILIKKFQQNNCDRFETYCADAFH